jgi:hypothetical protein
MDCFVASAFARRRASADKALPCANASRLSQAMTPRKFHFISNSRYTSAFSRRETPEVCVSLSLKREGAGNAGCALHPRSRVQYA